MRKLTMIETVESMYKELVALSIAIIAFAGTVFMFLLLAYILILGTFTLLGG